MRHKCIFCEDKFTDEELSELKEMGEKYWLTKTEFICPDCRDDLQRLPLEDQYQAIIEGSAYEWPSYEKS